MSTKGTKYHIALDGQGYILAGTPTRPQRVMTQQPVFGTRFASGDRDYSDFSLFWFLAQTDWTAGVKDEKKWKDDAHYYASSNIDAYTDGGSIQLSYAAVEESGQVDYVTAGTYGIAERTNGTVAGQYFAGDFSSVKLWYKESPTDSWTMLDQLTVGATGRSYISQIITHKNKIWYLSPSRYAYPNNSVAESVNSWFEDAQTDHSSAINTMLQGAGLPANAFRNSRCACEIGNSLYVALDMQSPVNYSIVVYTDDAGSTWNLLFYKSGGKLFIADMISYNSNLYYLLDTNGGNGGVELRYYDLTSNIDTLIRKFPAGKMPTAFVEGKFSGSALKPIGTGGRFMFINPKNGNLVFCMPLTLPNESNHKGELWEYNASTGAIERIWYTNKEKEIKYLSGYIGDGGTLHQNKIYFGNLIYDGEYFYNDVKSQGDVANTIMTGLFSDDTYLFYCGSMYQYTQRIKRLDIANYRSTEDANWIILNEIEEVSTIDKLADEITIVFDKFDVGEEIKVYYSLDGGTTYTSLGRASYTVDGATVSSKTFKFPLNVIFKKMMLKVYLNSDGSSTPKLHDISLKYLPLPNYDLTWQLQVKAIDNMKLLDNVSKEPKRGLELRNVLKNAWLNNRVIQFEDIDYVETKVNDATGIASTDTTITVDSTAGFPEQGSFQIDNEIIKYTEKSDTQFLSCTRGFRGTLADTHVDNQVVSTIKNVLIYKYEEKSPVTNDSKSDDYIIDLQLLEVSSGSGTTTSTTTTSSSTTTTSSSTTTTSSSTTTTSSSTTTTAT